MALAFAIVPASGQARALHRTGEDRARRRDAHLEAFAKISAPAAPRPTACKALRKAKQARAPRPEHGRALVRRARSAGGKARIARGPDPCLLLKAVQERSRDQGRARRARARRRRGRRASSPGSTARRRTGDARRDRGRAAARSASAARRKQLQEISFDTISGSGPERRHRALPRQRTPPTASCAPASCSSSTAARSTSTAPPTSRARSPSASRRAEMRERFTLVLKGHIAHRHRALSRRARAASTSTRSRAARCGRHGLDYDHGTGHGVGSYLSVHEGPQSHLEAPAWRVLRAGHDLLQRARLLQGGRLRHPHREPGAGDASRRRSPAATAR